MQQIRRYLAEETRGILLLDYTSFWALNKFGDQQGEACDPIINPGNALSYIEVQPEILHRKPKCGG